MTDQFTVRAVVLGLLALALTAVAGIILLAVIHTPSPQVLDNIAIGAMAALAGILAKTSVERPIVTATRADVDVSTTSAPRPAAAN